MAKRWMPETIVRRVVVLVVGGLALAAAGCAPQRTVSYEDPDAVETLTIGFGTTDVQQMADAMIRKMNTDPKIPKKDAEDPRLIVLLSDVRNKTQEHIDIKNVMSSIQTGLFQGERFRLAMDLDRRAAVQEELGYQASDWVDPNKARQMGKALGADVFLSGELTSIVKSAQGVKLVDYKLTLRLESIETGEILWIDEKSIRKRRG